MIQFSKHSRYLYLLIMLALLLNCGINTAGGGVIVNNPVMSGKVSFPEGQGARDAMVIIGSKGAVGLIDTTIGIHHGNFLVSYNLKMFDTTYCDVQGRFEFENIAAGDYVLVAERKEVGMFAMTTVNCSYNDSININIELKPAAKLTIKPYAFDYSDSSNFVAAQISGTRFTASYNDSTGLLEFDMIPAGELELILYKLNNTIEIYRGFNAVSDSFSMLLVDPHRSSSYWTAIESGPRSPLGRPYIISSSPFDGAQGEAVKLTGEYECDVEIQFSHPMDSKLTNSAVSVKSSDNMTSLDEIWWQGGNVMYLKLCTKSSSGECVRGDSLYRSGITYSVIIDTCATTSLGVKFAYPDTLTFIPKP